MIMRQRVHSGVFFARQERIDAGMLDREPKLVPWHRFEYGVRDKLTDESNWRDLVSVRQAAKALALIKKYCKT